jgi:Sigma-70, region 4
MAALAFHWFSKTIDIPASLRRQPLEAWQTSARLNGLLRRSGIRVLGDLHGRKVRDFASAKNCGAKTLHELDSLARGTESGAPTNGNTPFLQNGARFAIPESVCQLQFHELPITRRLGNVVRWIGARTLGDINGRSVLELLQYKACGWRTIGEIQQLIGRAISGEFDEADIDDSTAAAELLTLLEQGIAKLAHRERQFLLATIGGENLPCLSFAEIGRRSALTRSRVQQLVARAVVNLRKTWGPRVPRLLEIMERRCLAMACPLTPALLEQWIGESPRRFQLSIEAHVRLITALDKNILCCPVGDWQSRGRAKSSPDTSEPRATKRARNFHARSVLTPPSGSRDPIGTTFDWSGYGPREPERLSNFLPRQNGSRWGRGIQTRRPTKNSPKTSCQTLQFCNDG